MVGTQKCASRSTSTKALRSSAAGSEGFIAPRERCVMLRSLQGGSKRRRVWKQIVQCSQLFHR
jgi:hypothetical protein